MRTTAQNCDVVILLHGSALLQRRRTAKIDARETFTTQRAFTAERSLQIVLRKIHDDLGARSALQGHQP